MAGRFMNRESLIGWWAAFLIRALGCTLRFRLTNRSGICVGSEQPPVIWALWHNRLLMVPLIRQHYFHDRPGVALTSPSRDGAIIVKVMESFGMAHVRGSSSRRGATAMRELVAFMKKGSDVGITPDGPRGPRYKLGPGIVVLAQQTGAPMVPIQVDYTHFIQFNSWDRFRIPFPFSRVNITFGELCYVNPTPGNAEFEMERLRLEKLLSDAVRVS